ncbi:hypothetical protein [Chondrinema litorale]|uniref:hypothetical protein n=1 Tax=Chondrinema litorale TaxID=2994555 RepID=UPI0025429F4F|nr:hypothetical protein [Chondrinema litorale]UZR97973.1 hypothetical protein OQ292_28530 [Chondrinema litorale]
MNLEELGYTQKWIEYKILDEKNFTSQLADYQNGRDENTEHYRYATLRNWIENKINFSNYEINNFLEIITAEPDISMAGSAVKLLYLSSKISEEQSRIIEKKFKLFGEWAVKLIDREAINRRLLQEELTHDLFIKTIEFGDHNLIRLMIYRTNNIAFLNELNSNIYSKKIRNLASEKLKKLNLN